MSFKFIFLLCLLCCMECLADNPPKVTGVTVIDDTCKLKSDSGSCSEHMTRYYFDPSCLCCKEFVYGGCLGNGNNFRSNQECIMKCIGHIVSK